MGVCGNCDDGDDGEDVDNGVDVEEVDLGFKRSVKVSCHNSSSESGILSKSEWRGILTRNEVVEICSSRGAQWTFSGVGGEEERVLELT